MQQVIIIHGGDSYKTQEEYFDFLKNHEVTKEYFQSRHGWKTTIEEVLGPDFDVLQPRMPNPENAKFDEWKIWFERMFDFLDGEVILIGHSLGGMFLVKYLEQNDFPKKIKQLHLVAPPHNLTKDIADFFLPDSLENVSKQAEDITLYFSKDDPTVPFSEMENYKKQLPEASLVVFEDRGHFKQSEFSELILNIKKTE